MGLSSWAGGVFCLAATIFTLTSIVLPQTMSNIFRRAEIFATLAQGYVDIEVKEACHNTFLPPDLNCPRFLKNHLTVHAGIGHQFNELLFGLKKAQSVGMSYIFEPFGGSQKHKDDYTFINDLLGLPRLFSSLGGVSRQQAERISATMSSSWQNADDGEFTSNECNIFRSVRGYKHCTSASSGDCFEAPEHVHLYQDAMECLRTSVAAYGTAYDRCVFSQFFTHNSNESKAMRLLPNDTLVVVWHVRQGDRILHAPNDPMFAELMGALRGITEGCKLLVLLVGKGKSNADGTHSVTQEYVSSVSKLAETTWMGSDHHPHVTGPSFLIEDTFLAMMQADLLIGSGSSLPAIAALVSSEPLYFNHVPKNGFHYGAELTADSVDVEANGTVLDSHRRVRVALHERMISGRRRVCR